MPARRRPRTTPATARWQASVPEPQNDQLRRPHAQHVGDRVPGRIQQLPGPAGLTVQLSRVGPTVLQRGQQSLPRGRVQRTGRGRVQIDRVWRDRGRTYLVGVERSGHAHYRIAAGAGSSAHPDMESAVTSVPVRTRLPHAWECADGRVVCDRRQDDLGRERQPPAGTAALLRGGRSTWSQRVHRPRRMGVVDVPRIAKDSASGPPDGRADPIQGAAAWPAPRPWLPHSSGC